MDSVDHNMKVTDPLLACCICRCLLQEAVQLACLHNCCRECFCVAASNCSRSQAVCCGLCGTATRAGSEQPNGFIDCQVQRYRLIADSGDCGLCKGKAQVWCPACQHSLCENCIGGHKQYNRLHVTQSLDGLRSLDEVCWQDSASVCPAHKKPLDVACVDCEQAKCIICWAECNEMKHTVYVVGKKSFDAYAEKFVEIISNMEVELLRKSEVLEKPKCILKDMKAARDRHLEEISKRKRCIVDAVNMVYQEIEFFTKNAYDDVLEEGNAAAVAAECLSSDLSNARNYIRRLVDSSDKCQIINQQKVVQERLRVLSRELDCLADRLATTVRGVKIEASLPDDFDNTVRTWIGMPQLYSVIASSSLSPLASLHPSLEQQRKQCLSFGAATANIQLPLDCEDVALTKDGRSLLLAAQEHGMIELSTASRHELGRWQPPRLSSGANDRVEAVAALSDGRAAASLYYTETVVLLRRSEISGSGETVPVAASNAWSEESRLEKLLWPPQLLSAHGDVLAVCQPYGRRLQLMNLSSGRCMRDSEILREYYVGSLAVTARALVTGSLIKMQLGSGRRSAHVLDAHSLADGSDERMWRYIPSNSDVEDEEEVAQLQGICSDSNSCCLYVAVWMSDRRSDRVSALSLEDGSELQRVVLSFNSAADNQTLPPLLPVRLSLSDDRAAAAEHRQLNSSQTSGSNGGDGVALAALCWSPNTNEWRTVTVHCTTSKVL